MFQMLSSQVLTAPVQGAAVWPSDPAVQAGHSDTPFVN